MGLLRCYRTLLLCLHICRDTGVRGSHQAILTCTHRTILHAGKTAFAPADRGWQPGAGELLGWWLVPIGLALGLALRYPIDWVAQWWIRRYRSTIPQAT